MQIYINHREEINHDDESMTQSGIMSVHRNYADALLKTHQAIVEEVETEVEGVSYVGKLDNPMNIEHWIKKIVIAKNFKGGTRSVFLSQGESYHMQFRLYEKTYSFFISSYEVL